jgi:VWFA-related protein
MRLELAWAGALAGTLALSGRAASQASPPEERPRPTFEAATSAVLLDVVVRDKKGHPVRDLTAADFEIYEDGVRQQIDSFRAVSRGPEPERAEVSPAATAPALRPETEVIPRQALIAIVFDRLSPNARQLAHKAATTYLEQARRPDDLVGVFSIDIGLRTLQAYTTEAGLIRRGLNRAASLGTAQTGDAGQQARALGEREQAVASQQGAAQGAASAPVGSPAGGAAAQQAGAAAGALAAEQFLIQLNVETLRTFDELERAQHGYATTNGLMAVVNSLRLAPGRKTVLFFSEGLSIPPQVQVRFRSVIDTANRGNVSIYTMDAAGLRVESTSAEGRAELQASAARRLQQVSGRDEGGILMKDLERNEGRLLSDPHSGLGRLAEETGGFLIRDTNDLTAGVKRIDEDMRFHYMLAYAPSNQNYDGRFRTIAVKVSRPGMEIQTRKGYYAIRSRLPTPVLSYEAPALAALDRTPLPREFPLHAGALSFPEPSRPGLVPVVVEIPGNTLSFRPSPDNKSYEGEFVVAVRIRDASGRVVQKMSQHYPVMGPVSQIEAARKGEVLFYRETDLLPGRYMVDAVAYDALDQKSSVQASSVEVPPAEAGKLRLSSIVLVKRAERVPEEERKAGQPLAFGEVLIYPNLDEPISKSASKELTFFLTAYGGREASKPTATIEILQGGRRLAQAPAALPAPDASGRIQHVGGIPLAGFPPGEYQMRVVLSDSQTLQARSVSFTVTE